MKWFGRKAARVPARPFLVRGWSVVAPGEPWPRSYEARVREAFLSNPVAQRAVKLVAEGVAGAAVYAVERSPAEAGVQRETLARNRRRTWAPAFAGEQERITGRPGIRRNPSSRRARSA